MYAATDESSSRARRGPTARRLDAIDLKILSRLQCDGRITTVRLGELVNLSASACHERVSFLTARGLIKSFRAEIDLQRVVRYELVVVAITLDNHHFQTLDRFERRIAAIPEVIECIAVGGGADYLAKFAVTNIARYQSLFEQLLQENIGIRQYVMHVATKVVKAMSALPIEHLHAQSLRDAERD